MHFYLFTLVTIPITDTVTVKISISVADMSADLIIGTPLIVSKVENR